jgi:hypothetical protein
MPMDAAERLGVEQHQHGRSPGASRRDVVGEVTA